MNSDESSHLTSNFVPLVPFNSTDPNGGDSLTGNLNIYYEVKIVRQSMSLKWSLTLYNRAVT